MVSLDAFGEPPNYEHHFGEPQRLVALLKNRKQNKNMIGEQFCLLENHEMHQMSFYSDTALHFSKIFPITSYDGTGAKIEIQTYDRNTRHVADGQHCSSSEFVVTPVC